jgi:hypothetical protein
MGFNETILPGVGSRVLCQGRSGDSTILIGTIPSPESNGVLASSVLANKAILASREPVHDSVHKTGYASHITKGAVLNNNLPTDTVQGEKVIANEFGVMMGLFKLFANLKASELSQIQCHFLDDLVRIISHNFQHYTALGELRVFHDGQGIHLEIGATHDPDESMGNSVNPAISPTDPQTESNLSRFYKLSSDQLNMLERMKVFVGKLGQFVNFLIVKPANIPHTLDGTVPKTPDTGLLQVKAGLDGTLILRSANGIYLEKTDWIRVPHRIRTPEDPTGDAGDLLDYPTTEDYTFTDTYTALDANYNDTAFLYYLQLKDYLAYINEEIGYANFKAQTKDFYVNDDITKETELNNITFVDPLTGSSFKKNKSCIALMKNGGISLSDSWGSAINMEGGNIYIQPAKDLIVQPNRNIIGKVGGNISIAAQQDIDLSSTSGGMRVKTNLAQYLYSSQGGIVLHTDGQDFTNNVSTYPNSTVISSVSGIVINAPNSSISANASQIGLNASNSLIATSPDAIIQTTNDLLLLSDQSLYLSSNVTGVFADQEIISFSNGSNVMIGLSQSLVGIKGQYFGAANFGGGEIPVEGLLPQSNKFITQVQAVVTQLEATNTAKLLDVFSTPTQYNTIKFQFLPSSYYELEASDVIPQTVSQQIDALLNENLNNWIETPVNNTYPYPGNDNAQTYITIPLSNISNTDLANKAVGLISQEQPFAVKNIFTDYKSF